MIETLEAAFAENIPGDWDGPVGGYPNRTPPWSPADFARFHRVYRISVRREAWWARGCRTIDRENGAALAMDVPGFVLERETSHHRDATVYVDLSNWPQQSDELAAAKIGAARIRLHIADWTGEPHRLGPDVLGHDFEGNPWWDWAVQFMNAGPFTRTEVHGPADFSRG
jgi:hypothetical protein